MQGGGSDYTPGREARLIRSAANSTDTAAAKANGDVVTLGGQGTWVGGETPFSPTVGAVTFSSVAQLCPALCDPMNCSTPGRVFSNESVLRIRWPKYWRFSFSISLSNEYSGLISFRMGWLDPLQSRDTFSLDN